MPSGTPCIMPHPSISPNNLDLSHSGLWQIQAERTREIYDRRTDDRDGRDLFRQRDA